MGAIYGKYQSFKSNNIIVKSVDSISNDIGDIYLNRQTTMENSQVKFWLKTSLPPALCPNVRDESNNFFDGRPHINFKRMSNKSSEESSVDTAEYIRSSRLNQKRNVKENYDKIKRRKLDSERIEQVAPVTSTVRNNKISTQKLGHNKPDDFVVSSMITPPKPYRSNEIVKSKFRRKRLKIKPVNKISLAVRNFKRTRTLEFIKSNGKYRKTRNFVHMEPNLKNATRQEIPRTKELTNGLNVHKNVDVLVLSGSTVSSAINTIQTTSNGMNVSSFQTEIVKVVHPKQKNTVALNMSNATYVVSNPVINHDHPVIKENTNQTFLNISESSSEYESSLSHYRQPLQKQDPSMIDNINTVGIDNSIPIIDDNSSSSGSSSTLFPIGGIKLSSYYYGNETTRTSVAHPTSDLAVTSTISNEVTPSNEKNTKLETAPGLDCSKQIVQKQPIASQMGSKPNKSVQIVTKSVAKNPKTKCLKLPNVELINERRASLRSSTRKLIELNGHISPHQTPVTSHPVKKKETGSRTCNRKIMSTEQDLGQSDKHPTILIENESPLNQTYTIETETDRSIITFG